MTEEEIADAAEELEERLRILKGVVDEKNAKEDDVVVSCLLVDDALQDDGKEDEKEKEEEDDNDDMEDIRRPRAFSAFAEEEVIRAPDADFVMANVDSFLD